MLKYDKAAKEAHVSGLTGSTVSDVNSVALAMPLAVLLWSTLQSRQRTFTPYKPVAIFVDFLINCCATLFATTIYSSSTWLFNFLLILPAVFIATTSQPVTARSSKPPVKELSKSKPPSRLPIKPFITHYRGSMLVITCVAILAVDFRIFPRRFAKVENWGTSLMDMGVGSFVFSSGVVSARSLLKNEAGVRLPFAERLVRSTRHSLPLLVLGVLRLLSVKGLDYAEHVTEYGVHWNFFFTLGLLPPFVAVFQSLFDFLPSYALLSLILATLYEIALDRTDLGKFILTAPRTDLLSQNREGLFSFIGYLAIFLAGQSLGMSVLPRQASVESKSSWRILLRRTILGKLVLATTFWTVLFYWTVSYAYGLGLRLSVSRRLANLPYVLWVSSFNSGQITLCYAIERIFFPQIYKASSETEEAQRARDATSPVLSAFNRNGLAVFLLANLLTGLVNLTLPTLQMGTVASMAMLLAYIAALSAVALTLDRMNVSIKL
ncbi:GPI-anchored wall transfer protein 1 [Westerdykella ornata]|uniref:GPI-anchored wall transfer protein n=1 Tax=Westerdykella ornata TaxID=318751 RepID=A0A6A6JK41_WESOR|nr:GPI-anchored wall transfer protein 1 [Westerdykella ornata]KAF2276961.1 GPI-anchored wall transfer protein 1 [Westerdykella ornata]